jgi:hypothetical protein
MAAGNFTPYNSFPYHTAKNEINFLSDVIKALLAKTAYVPNVATHVALSDITNECTDTDYARLTLGTKTLTQDGSGRTVWGAANCNFGSAVSIAARYLILFKDSGVGSTSWLLGYVDLNSGGSVDVSSVTSQFEVDWNAAGIYRFTP